MNTMYHWNIASDTDNIHFPFYRNPIHSQRPPFSKISATLNASSSSLLQWTEEDCSVAGELRGQLSEAKFLHQDLQNTYHEHHHAVI